MAKSRSFRRYRNRAWPTELGIIIFLTLVGLWVLGRISFFSVIVTAPDCLSIEPALLGRNDRIDGVLDTLALAGAGAICLIAVTGIIGSRERTASMGSAMFGAANFGIAGLLVAQWMFAWAFFNPDSWLAKAAMPMVPQMMVLALHHGDRDAFEGMPGWHTVGEASYFNAEIGVLVRRERVKSCFPAPLVRQNLSNMNPDGFLPNGVAIASISDGELDKSELAYVYYDQHFQYLTSELHFDHEQYPTLQKRDAERDASGRRVDPEHVLKLVQDSLEFLPAQAYPLRPFSRDEIDQMVKATWDREAPEP
ncbi:MAG TPA: hypothetical protein PLX06_07445 [Fimbriimonadaceae bacterium]|nr:hypothetical protein [Hyphomonas sp.]HRK21624.1 hypothetical protein [Fimbriimonadaceae bacterium]